MTAWRVITWNILGAKDPDLDAIAAVLREREPDVVGLQEVRRSQIRRLAKRLGWRYAWARKHYPYGPLVWWRAEGIGIVSPWRVSARLRTTISPGVSTWTFRHRVLLAATIARRDGKLRVFNTHLSSHDPNQRIEQAGRVAHRVGADPAPLVIAVGDLNTTGDSAPEVLREFRAVGLHDAGGTVSNPATNPYQRIDYVLLPTAATVLDSATPAGGEEWANLSDHLPVTVTFEA